MNVRPITDADRPALARLADELWGADIVVGHDTVFHPVTLPGFLAFSDDGEIVGVLTYTQVGDAVEVVTIDALRRHGGIGTALLAAVASTAHELGAISLVLTTTNDNIDALRFYQRRGFRLVAVRPGAVNRSRLLKPSIPLTGDYDIPLTDELELIRPLP